MTEESRAIDSIINFVKNTIKIMTKNLPYDYSIPRAKIIKSLGNSKYEITNCGTIYSVSSLNNISYDIGDHVMITFPQGVLENGIIMGKTQ